MLCDKNSLTVAAEKSGRRTGRLHSCFRNWDHELFFKLFDPIILTIQIRVYFIECYWHLFFRMFYFKHMHGQNHL